MTTQQEKLIFVRSLLNIGAYDEAVKILGEILAAYPGEKPVVAMLAEAHARFGTLEKRRVFFESVRHLRDPDLIAGLGDTYIGLGWHDPAIEAYRESLSFDEWNGRTWMLLGRAYELKKAFPEAIKAFEKSRDCSTGKPWECDCFLCLAGALSKSGLLDQARAVYEKILSLFPYENRAKMGLKTVGLGAATKGGDSATFFLMKTLQESWADQFALVLYACLKRAIMADGKVLDREREEFERIMRPLRSLLPDWNGLENRVFSELEIKKLVAGLPSEARILILEYVAQIVAIDQEWDSQEESYFRKLVTALEIEGKTSERIRFTHIPVEWKHLAELAERLEYGDVSIVENLLSLWDRYWNSFWNGKPPKVSVVYQILKSAWEIMEFQGGEYPCFRLRDHEKAQELRSVIRQEYFSKGAYGAHHILSDLVMENVCRVVLQRLGPALAQRMAGMIFLNRALLAFDTFLKLPPAPDWKEETGNRPLFVTIRERPAKILALMEEINMHGLTS
jgi:tetratricopeptide (TPR) repeat protein